MTAAPCSITLFAQYKSRYTDGEGVQMEMSAFEMVGVVSLCLVLVTTALWLLLWWWLKKPALVAQDTGTPGGAHSVIQYVCSRAAGSCTCRECPRVLQTYISRPKCGCGHTLMLSSTGTPQAPEAGKALAPGTLVRFKHDGEWVRGTVIGTDTEGPLRGYMRVQAGIEVLVPPFTPEIELTVVTP